ncbi:hypothetical protein [Halonotius sp. GCM10025705]|uniref:phage NrS-1 polymerase family protein n=1 Tax=Halonotius sp. GCM10025705 TaxID=3252678 RepID=UPI003615D098
MPKYYAYKSGSGGYIQTQINDSPQTLQVAPSAETLLSELGFEFNEYVPRDVTKPLVIVGVLGTKPYGLSKFELLDGMPALASNYCELTSDQQNHLRAYLQERTVDLSTDEYEYLRQFLKNESPLEPISHRGTERQQGDIDHTPDPAKEINVESVSTDAIPSMLQDLDQWICWRIDTRNRKETKIPVSPHDDGLASVDDPSTWADFSVAAEAAQRDDVDGLGFVFTEEDTIAGIDLDDMRNPETGSLSERAQDIITTVNSYTEVSPSGSGLHILLRGFVPEGRQRHDGIELYDRGRFFTVTGDRLDDHPDTVAVRHDELRSIHEKHVAREPEERVDSGGLKTGSDDQLDATSGQVLDTDSILEHAKQNKTFRRLWDGSTAGYESHSEADMAMCTLLAYYTGDNRSQMDALFRRSGLMRDKWDEQRGDQTYGELTLQKAIEYVDEYDPRLHTDPDSDPTSIAEIEPDQSVTIQGAVADVESVPTEEIDQAGELVDESGRVRFVIWSSDYWGPDVEFADGETYLLRDAWVREFEGQREVHLNEHTEIEEIDE